MVTKKNTENLKWIEKNPENFKKDTIIDLWIDVLNKDISAGKIFSEYEKNGRIVDNFINKIDENNFLVDFRKNINAENNIWLSEVMPSEVKKVHIVWIKEGRKYDMVWTRQWLKWGFYDEKWRYLPIYNWFKINVLESHSKEELTEKQKENDEKISKLSNNSIFTDFKEIYKENEFNLIIKKWVQYWIDPIFLLSLRKANAWEEWKQFWVMNPNMDTFEWQLNMFCRIIQDSLNNFKNVRNENPIENDWNLSWEFIGYFANIYNSSNLDKNHFKDIVRFYWEYSWKDFGDEEKLFTKVKESNLKWETKYNNNIIKWTTNPEELISNANKYLWMKYSLWWSWKKYIDCSQLVINSLKNCWIVSQGFDTDASGLLRYTTKKEVLDVQRWDLVFHEELWKINHVEIATWSIENWEIPIIDAANHIWEVSYRTQKVNPKWKNIIVGKPVFYS